MSADDSQDNLHQQGTGGISSEQQGTNLVLQYNENEDTETNSSNVAETRSTRKSSKSESKNKATTTTAKAQHDTASLGDLLVNLSDSRKRKLESIQNDISGHHSLGSDPSTVYKNVHSQQSHPADLFPKKLIPNSYANTSNLNGVTGDYDSTSKRQKLQGEYEDAISARQLECLTLDKELKTLQKIKYEIEIESLKKVERENLELKKLEKVKMSLEIDKLRLEKEKLEMEVNKIRCENVSAM